MFPSRNSVSKTINRLLSQCLSQCTLPFASVRLTVMESFGLMDASGVGFYLLLPLYLCLHPLTVAMSVCTFSIACEHGDWGYDQCKCTIWHSECGVQRAGGNRGEDRNHLLCITSCRISRLRGETLWNLALIRTCGKIKYVTAFGFSFDSLLTFFWDWNLHLLQALLQLKGQFTSMSQGATCVLLICRAIYPFRLLLVQAAKFGRCLSSLV